MRIESILWERVTITYKEPVGVEHKSVEVYERAFVTYKDGSLMIRSHPTNPENQRHLGLAKPTLIELSPWSMKWEAYFWEVAVNSPAGPESLRSTLAVVIAEF